MFFLYPNPSYSFPPTPPRPRQKKKTRVVCFHTDDILQQPDVDIPLFAKLDHRSVEKKSSTAVT